MNKNTFKTAILLAVLGMLCIAIGRLFGTAGALIGLVVAFAITGGSYWFSDKLAIKAARARALEPDELPWLRTMVSDLSTQAGIPMPKLFISPSPQPNAFATGRSPQHASVAVTEGILQLLEQDELKGVIAHELSHVKNRDILITSVAAAFGTAVGLLANFLPFGLMSNDEEERPNFAVVIALSIAAPLAATIAQLALSRSREFQADASGAHLLEGGEPLARALIKIDAYARQIPMDVSPAAAQAYIINPLAGVSMRSLFSTHPPTEERVARLRANAGATR